MESGSDEEGLLAIGDLRTRSIWRMDATRRRWFWWLRAKAFIRATCEPPPMSTLSRWSGMTPHMRTD